MEGKRKKKIKPAAAATHAVLLLWGFISLFPVYIMVMGSFKSSSELLHNSVGLPEAWSLENYISLWNYNSGTIMRTYLNSLFVSTVYTVLAICLAAMAGYAFAKFTFPGKNILFVMFLMTMMVPQELNLTPLYLMYSRIKWLNTYRVQIVTGLANVFAMFMFRKNMETIPDALIESAKIEGANQWTIFTKIVTPVSKPVYGALAILVFLSKWNEYLLPKMFISKTEYLPIMVILPKLSVGDNLYAVPWELVLTGCTIVTIPLIIIFLMFQDKFLASVTLGAVKG
ncbi:MAG: carbohydrate ABC transporter permease [Candidatus Limivivens sp.]|nr:carbohydrate ABC transporter permease [Candidatus Limivivens sp.]